MLPNHAPLVIAEQFGTLEALYPGRIDLGLSRASGSDQATSRALRRDLASHPDALPQDVLELLDFMSDEPRQAVRAVPGKGAKVPVWILGSSLFGAQRGDTGSALCLRVPLRPGADDAGDRALPS
jgi:luciferase family oxidoreductase group 1